MRTTEMKIEEFRNYLKGVIEILNETGSDNLYTKGFTKGYEEVLNAFNGKFEREVKTDD